MILECWTPSRTRLVLIGSPVELQAVLHRLELCPTALIHLSASRRVLTLSGDDLRRYTDAAATDQRLAAVGPISDFHPRRFPKLPEASEPIRSGAHALADER